MTNLRIFITLQSMCSKRFEPQIRWELNSARGHRRQELALPASENSDLFLLYGNCHPVWTSATTLYYSDVCQDDKSHHLNLLDQMQSLDKPVAFWRATQGLNLSHWLK